MLASRRPTRGLFSRFVSFGRSEHREDGGHRTSPTHPFRASGMIRSGSRNNETDMLPEHDQTHAGGRSRGTV